MKKTEEIRKTINSYLKARKALLLIGQKYNEELSGNDNIIGRIGEYIGLMYLRSIGQKPVKAQYSNNVGYDFIEKKLRTQVKVISAENKYGRTVRLKEPWDQFVLILLDKAYRVSKIGLISKSQYRKALSDNHMTSKTPYASVTMLGEKGLFNKYGTIESNFKY